MACPTTFVLRTLKVASIICSKLSEQLASTADPISPMPTDVLQLVKSMDQLGLWLLAVDGLSEMSHLSPDLRKLWSFEDFRGLRVVLDFYKRI
jgi:hypothetical protein